VNLIAQIRIRGVAARIGIAVGEQLVERPLRVARGVHRQTHVGRRHAVENGRTHAVAMLAHVDEGRTRPV